MPFGINGGSFVQIVQAQSNNSYENGEAGYCVHNFSIFFTLRLGLKLKTL
jgi:hypothetical protein